MQVTDFFAGIPVANYDSALEWYERFVGRAPDVLVAEKEVMWQVASNRWFYVVGDPDRAGKALLTFFVDDLETFAGGLVQRGMDIEPFDTSIKGVRKVTVCDPEGNRITVAEMVR